ncbi:MAG: SCO family protein [Gammaproteobacteria bacterium]|jgi:protein SCO1/2|nr:SCO family protein [Gammaproteobacteria bacterium]MDH3758276.1 SCO family protein [Gammaproteobacteria bacterium]MDH3846704.1 SCO family protein [Gammaproteobacteria bacterium]MDH3862976.1 SCO family protein [Gammaproteobacteria bacterium]MDH3904317.1 SCO family protein [Gammaproteobacteria bacterium]
MKIDFRVLLGGCKRILLLAVLAVGFATLSAAPTYAGDAGSVWGKDYFPNYELTAHTGETLRFFDDVIEGKVVAVNFIFTSCKDVCPMETARMASVYEILGDRVGSDVFFYSITIDPETDTVEVLRDYADRFGVNGDNWKFLTGNKEEIDTIRARFGLFGDPEEEQDLSNHNINLMLGNQSTGQWVRRSPFENPYILANQLGTWLHGFRKVSAHTSRDYASAPKLRQISDGEMMFRDRCSSCHVISGGHLPQRAARVLGPDLFGVTERRDDAWLRRWMAEPDKMIESGDPIAVAMSSAWEVVMPNFRLDPNEIDNLIRYMETESDRVRQQYASASSGSGDAHHDHAAHHGKH